MGDFDRRCALHTDLLPLAVDSSTKDAGMRPMWTLGRNSLEKVIKLLLSDSLEHHISTSVSAAGARLFKHQTESKDWWKASPPLYSIARWNFTWLEFFFQISETGAGDLSLQEQLVQLDQQRRMYRVKPLVLFSTKEVFQGLPGVVPCNKHLLAFGAPHKHMLWLSFLQKRSIEHLLCSNLPLLLWTIYGCLMLECFNCQ